MTKALSVIALATIAALSLAGPKVTVKWDKKALIAGSKITGTVRVEFEPGMHGYQNPPLKEYQIPIKLSTAKAFLLTAKYPKGEVKVFNGEEAAVYAGVIEIPITITLPKKVGTHKLSLTLDFQECNDSTCYPPGSLVVEQSLKVIKK